MKRRSVAPTIFLTTSLGIVFFGQAERFRQKEFSDNETQSQGQSNINQYLLK